MLSALNCSSKWSLLPNRHWILRSYPRPYIRFWICRQKRCKNDYDYENFIIVTVICLRLWCRLSIKQSWNCVNENPSIQSTSGRIQDRHSSHNRELHNVNCRLTDVRWQFLWCFLKLWISGYLWVLPLVTWSDGFSQPGCCMLHSLG